MQQELPISKGIFDKNNTEENNFFMSDHEPLKDRLSRQVDSLCVLAASQGVSLADLMTSFEAVQKLTDDVTHAMSLVLNGMQLQETSLDAVLAALPKHYQAATEEVAIRCRRANEVNAMNMAMCLASRQP